MSTNATAVKNVATLPLQRSMLDSKVEHITPQKAKAYLDTSPYNRACSDNRIKSFAEQMLCGAWDLTHQGIAFDEDGRLIDGHHRLKAIQRANIPVYMHVTRNVPRKSYKNIDTGGQKTMSHRIDISEAHVSIIRMLIDAYLPNSNKLAMRTEFIMKMQEIYRDEINYAIDACTKRADQRIVSSAPVRAALTVAQMHEPIAKIDEFSETFRLGVRSASPNRLPAILRDYLEKNGNHRGRNERITFFLLMSLMIKQFCAGKSIKSTRGIPSVIDDNGQFIQVPYALKKIEQIYPLIPENDLPAFIAGRRDYGLF